MKKIAFFIVLSLLTSGTALAAAPEPAAEEEVIQAYVQQAFEIVNE